eukprot:g17158.t1
MTLLIERIALGAVCVAMRLASTQAFVPSASVSSSTSAWKHVVNRGQTVGNTAARGGARTADRGRRVGVVMSTGENDLFVVGAGFLGKIIGRKWHEEHPEATMYGETRSYTRHQDRMPEGMTHVRRKFRDEKEIKCPNVVFCANPGGNHDYALEVFRAREEVWDGTGMFIFTSSGSVYAETKGGVVTEDSPIDEKKVDSPLRIAEKVTVQRGGCVVRLAGLYSLQRGPHSVWLDEKSLNLHSQGEINLISYDDAASAVVAALRGGLKEIRGEEGAPQVKGQIFLAAGDKPITRQKICEVALAHPFFSRKKMPKFWLDATPKEFAVTGPSKVYDSTVTRRTLGWEPRASSMAEYFEQESLWGVEGRVLELE